MMTRKASRNKKQPRSNFPVVLGTTKWPPHTEGLRRIILRAEEIAKKLKCNYVGTELLLIAWLEQLPYHILKILEKYKITPESVKKQLLSKGMIIFSTEDCDKPDSTPRVKHLIEVILPNVAKQWSKDPNGYYYIGVYHLILGILKLQEGIAYNLLKKMAKRKFVSLVIDLTNIAWNLGY